MPPKAKFTREEIIETAFQLARSDGLEKITARELGKRLEVLQDRFLRFLRVWKK